MLLIICGVAGYYLTKNDYPIAPLVLGLVLWPMIENNFRRALTIANGDYNIFFREPLSVIFLIIALLWVTIPILMKLRGKNVVINDEG
jgi:putative tricarboxylic transport membrane protein